MTEAGLSTNETLEEWLFKRHRISTTSILNALNDLGATHITDLLDLTEEDLIPFQPPFLKKLEYVRLTRGISFLKQQHQQQQQNNPSSLGKTTILQVAGPKSGHQIELGPEPAALALGKGTLMHLYEYNPPPLPSQCPTTGCNGTLSVYLGTRKSKYLMKIPNTPDSRWTATCTFCSKKWHCCHFHCGNLQKISSLGTSDIIRHEQGRFNHFHRKIQPPCSKNPFKMGVKAGYMSSNTHEMKRPPAVVHIRSLEGDSSLTETRDVSTESWSSPPTTADVLDPSCLKNAFDDDFNSILDSLDYDDDGDDANNNENKKNGDGSDCHDDDVDKMNDMTPFDLENTYQKDCPNDLSTSTDHHHHASPICPYSLQGDQPANKKMKTGENTSSYVQQVDEDICLEKLCSEMDNKCIIQRLLNKIA